MSNFDVFSDQEEEEEKETKTGIDLGISLEKLSLGPKKKLLVIPLGGFIVHHYGRFNFLSRDLKWDCGLPAISRNSSFTFIPLIHLFYWILLSNFIYLTFRHNVEAILTQAIGEFKNKFLFIWLSLISRSKTRFKCLESVHKPLFLKEVKYIWEKYSSYSAFNTLLITAPDKALLNPPNTGIFPKEIGTMMLFKVNGPNGELQLFLDGLVEAKDVQSYMEKHPLGEPPITPSHPDCFFYSKNLQLYNLDAMWLILRGSCVIDETIGSS
ncbi:hypothetical protein LXL04_036060 [Taraxacum kok-saghyz]